MTQVQISPTFEGWQKVARALLTSGTRPEAVLWQETGEAQSSFDLGLAVPEPATTEHSKGSFRVPGAFIEAGKSVALHRDAVKWPLLYQVLWRLTHGEPKLLDIPADADVLAMERLDRQVRQDAYRMRAFLRFRETQLEGQPWFVAWYEPEHHTLACNEEFFKDRFASMRWSILTPDACMHWNGVSIAFSPGVSKAQAPDADHLEPLWITYYSNIFNPARANFTAMRAQLLKRNWKNLPEAAVIEPLLRTANERTEQMVERSHRALTADSEYGLASPPAGADLKELKKAAARCTACPLYKNATCVVFGEGPARARIVLVGEQPGDQEDREGKPFIGPAGKMLDRALEEAGVDRTQVYVTNAVKHFKFVQRGNRRMHDTPSAREVKACRPWLEAELDRLRPELLVALGATAARSIFNTATRIGDSRGKILETRFGKTLVTIHPSALLRIPDRSAVELEYRRFVEDLRLIKSLVQ
ncbi:MAG TPA: UdgX family uracil-DNA binding protein [Clostridia bacterium]|nr:UdgX family uracil-DNA binding protein [Clostridia bacterium]